MEQRIETIESKLLHLELAYEALNEVVFKQSKELDVARKQIENLQAQLKELIENGPEQAYSIEDERPPHY